MKKRPPPEVTAQSTSSGAIESRYACESCTKRKIKCDRGAPCLPCSARGVACTPSPIETTERPRKKRFAEAELLRVIRRYERVLVENGFDLDTIRSAEDDDREDGVKDATQVAGPSASRSGGDEYNSVLSILDGGGEDSGAVKWPYERGKDFYDRIFKNDDSATLFALEPAEGISPHPDPFDMAKLWQVYVERVHPVNKFVHAPSFQRTMYAYGNHLSAAPASDQALCFAVYLAATVSLTTEECEVMFFTARSTLLEAYKLATQVWLRRAQLWRSSELSVLQALIVFLSSMQNFADSRSVVCFTAAAERIARRMGLHSRGSSIAMGYNLVEQEIRVRLWWEVVLLDTKAVERAGLGTSVMAGNWDQRLSYGHSDADLDCLVGHSLRSPRQMSLEMLIFLIRSEGAGFLASLRHSNGISVGCKEVSLGSILAAKASQQGRSIMLRHLQKIDDFERHLQHTYLRVCDDSNYLHRLAKCYAKLLVGRLRMSACISGESQARDVDAREALELTLLEHCAENMSAFNEMRADLTLKHFEWFMMQNLPIVGYILMLRLLKVHISGKVVDEAWRALEEYKRLGTRLLMDSLTLKAWDARNAASPPLHDREEPSFILDARMRVRSGEDRPHLDADPTKAGDSDFMALLLDMISGEVNYGF